MDAQAVRRFEEVTTTRRQIRRLEKRQRALRRHGGGLLARVQEVIVQSQLFEQRTRLQDILGLLPTFWRVF
jgi:hypothetical protein